MSITSILNTAVTGLMASQSALRVVSNNIANINTEGYAREVVRQENIVVGGESAGVRVTDIERIVDRFLQAAGLDARSRSAQTGTEDQFNQRFQGLIGRPDSKTTIAARINQLFGVIANLAIDPSGQVLRQSTLASMQDLADEINRVSDAIQDLRNEASQQIQEQVVAVNELLERIHDLNPLIVRQRAIGGESAGLENRRDQALSELSQLIDIRIARNSDGTIGLSTTSGSVLLDSAVRELDYSTPSIVTSETQFKSIQIWRIDPRSGERIGISRDFDLKISSGTLRGLLNLRDTDLRDMSLTLGELSATMVNQINAIHNAYTSVPPPNQLVGEQLPITPGQFHFFSGTTTFAIVDENNNLVDSYTINFDTDLVVLRFNDLDAAATAALGGAGTLDFADGVMTFTATNPLHGVVIADDPNSPTARGGQGFSDFFGMNDLLSAAVSTSYNTGLPVTAQHVVGAGTITFAVTSDSGKKLAEYTLDPIAAGIDYVAILADLNAATALGNYLNFDMDANGAMVITTQPGAEGARLTVLDDTTDVAGTGISFSQQFGIGDRYLVDPSKNVQVVNRIFQQPTQMALATFDLTAAIGETVVSKGDQSGASMSIFLCDRLSRIMISWPLLDKCKDVGQPQNPSPPRTRIFMIPSLIVPSLP